MSWQNCPHCMGTGLNSTNYTSSALVPCPVCHGRLIIDTVTGNPPAPSKSELRRWEIQKEEQKKEGSVPRGTI